VYPVVFAPDGATLASGGGKDGTVRLWDVASGKERHRLAESEGTRVREIAALAFSPDGKRLASANARHTFITPAEPHEVRFWDTATGQEVGRLTAPDLVRSLVFSPDGRALATGGVDRTVRLWELATGKERLRFAGHENTVSSVTISADGRRLFSGSDDGTALVWDATGLAGAERPPAAPLTAEELEALWAGLADDDAARAYRAIRRLAAAPRQAAALCRERLRPVADADAGRVTRLLAGLDSENFGVREKATKELEKLGESALPFLKRALGGGPPLETRRRVEALLEKAANLSSDRLRALRALEVLEQAGTPEARQALETLAEGVAEARLTREAKAALERLARRALSRHP
jgi:hypothetical protein